MADMIPVLNSTDETIPPYSIVVPTGDVDADAASLLVGKPTENGQAGFLVTGPLSIDPGDTGLASAGPFHTVAYDPADDDPAVGDTLGPGVDSWAAVAAENGMVALSAGADGVVNAIRTAPASPPGPTAWKQPVRVATTAAGTLATSFESGDTVDGVTLVAGDRILIKDQSTASQNGVYVVQASGTPTRAADADSGSDLLGAVVVVTQGTANADTIWLGTANATITVGSTSLPFVKVYPAAAGSAGREPFAATLSEITGAGSAQPRTVNSSGVWSNDGSAVSDKFYAVEIESGFAVKPTAKVIAYPSKTSGYFEFVPLQYADRVSSVDYPGFVSTGTQTWTGSKTINSGSFTLTAGNLTLTSGNLSVTGTGVITKTLSVNGTPLAANGTTGTPTTPFKVSSYTNSPGGSVKSMIEAYYDGIDYSGAGKVTFFKDHYDLYPTTGNADYFYGTIEFGGTVSVLGGGVQARTIGTGGFSAPTDSPFEFGVDQSAGSTTKPAGRVRIKPCYSQTSGTYKYGGKIEIVSDTPAGVADIAGGIQLIYSSAFGLYLNVYNPANGSNINVAANGFIAGGLMGWSGTYTVQVGGVNKTATMVGGITTDVS